jgi:DNA-binding CsgD family transcriptional regulator/type II secretory pathway predicted ATPase ExeA
MSWPLVGRREELDVIADCLGSDRPTSVVIVGAAGVGKTRLALAAGAEAQKAGVIVLSPVLGTRAAAAIPFGAVAELLPEHDASTSGRQLLRTVSASIRKRGQGNPVALIVDDAHLLDPESAALVLHLAAVDELAVVAAVRSGELCPDAVTALWKDRGGLRFDLQPLSDAEVSSLLEAALPGGMVDGRLVRDVSARSRGNPLYCRELVNASLAAGRIQRIEGIWRKTGETVLGERLTELVGHRVGALDETERTAMELVALAEPIALELLERLVGAHTAGALEARRLLSVDRSTPPHVRLGHPIYGDIIRRQLGEVRRRQHSEVLAAASEAAGNLDRHGLVRVATWRLDAGAADPELLTKAAAAASSLFDHELAVRLASAALDRGAGTTTALILAAAETARNRFAAAEAALVPWEAKIDSETDGKAYISQRVPLLRWGLDDGAAADALLTRAHTWLRSRSWRQYLDAWAIELDQDAGRIDKAARDGRDLLQHGDLEPETELLATFATSVALLFCGQTRDAQAFADASFVLARARAIDLREHAWGALAAWMAVRLESGRDRGEIEPLARHVHDYALRHDDDELLGLAQLTLGRIALTHGDVDAAQRWLSEAAAHLDDCDPRYIRGVCLAMLARVEAQHGRADAAQAAQAHADATYPTMQRTHWMYRHEYARARAWVTAANGDLPTATRALLAAADDCDEYALTEISFLHDALRLGASPADVAMRMTTLAERTDSELAHTQAAHASAAQNEDGRALELVAERFTALGAGLLAAEAQSSAGRVHASAGDVNRAQRAAARASDLLAACPGARTPLIDVPERQTLTQREHHIARLAASGLSNNEIADRLVVSVRTVESHLYHAFDKLGVNNRSQLKASLANERAQEPIARRS